MNRLVLRFKQGGCLSTDMIGEEWEPALAELLHRKEMLFASKVINKVEMMIYQPDHRLKFFAKPVKVNLETFKYEPKTETETKPKAKAKQAKPKAQPKSEAGSLLKDKKPKRARKTTVATETAAKA